MTSNHLFTFCRNNIEAIKKIIEYLICKQPSVEELAFFDEYDQDIFEWAKECMIVTDGRNKETIITNLVMSNKVYDLANKACLIQLKLINLSKRVKIESSKFQLLNKLCRDICSLRDSLARSHIAPPVKFEPYVIHFTGERGIGKSFINQELPYDLLNAINYKSFNEVMYVRSAGNAYWNGLCHQPVVLYDDWYQINTPEYGGVQVMELLQLKTRAVFNPPMAVAEEKNIRYNPLIVILISNNPFPKYEGVQDPKAIYRRHDVLIHVRKTAEFRNTPIKDIDKFILEDQAHLEFHFWPDPLDYHHRPEIDFYTNYNTMKERLIIRFKEYYKDECVKYSKAIQRVNRLYPKTGEECFKLPHQRFWTSLEEYLSHVPYVDNEFNEKVSQAWQDKRKGILNSVSDVFFRVMGRAFRPNMESEDVTTDMPLSKESEDVFEEAVPFYDAELGADVPKFCVHSIVAQSLDNDFIDLQWLSEYDQWKVNFGTVDVDWDIISEYVDKAYDAKFPDSEIVDEDGTFYDFINGYDLHSERAPMIIKYFSLVYEQRPKALSNSAFELIPFLLAFSYQVGRFYSFQNNDIIYDAIENCFYVCHKDCKFKNCIFDSKCKRNRFVGKFISNNAFLDTLRESGCDITELVPKEYAESLCGFAVEADVEEKISWMKGFWKKLVDLSSHFNRYELYKWINRILTLLMIFGPIIVAVYMVKKAIVRTDKCVELLESAMTPERILEEMSKNQQMQELLIKHLNVEELEPQGFASGDAIVRGVKKSPTRTAKKMLRAMKNPQGQMQSRDEMLSLQKIILRNTFFIACLNPETGGVRIGRCLGVFGQCAIIPTHYVEVFEKQPNWQFFYLPSINPVPIKINFNQLQFREFEDSSLTLMKLPANLGTFKRLTHRFATIEEHSRLNGVCSILEVVAPDDSSAESEVIRHVVASDTFNKINVGGSEGFNGFVVTGGYTYYGFSGQGCCGSVLLSEKPVKIIGMHVAGCESGEGISEYLNHETLMAAEREFGLVLDPELHFIGELGRANCLPDCSVITLGRVDAKLAHRENEKSRIVPSLIQQRGQREDFPLYKDVAVLSPRDPRLQERFSPMLEGVKFHGMPLEPFDAVDVSVAASDVLNMVLAKCRPQRSDIGKLTILEACRGFEGLKGYDHLEWRTSEGFPFVAQRPKGVHDKKWLFDFDENNLCVGVNPELEALVVVQQKMRAEGVIPFTVFTDCLKDTTVSLEKVLQPGKTRIFSMAPVQFSIACRQLCLDFVVATMACRLDLEHAVGINPDSYEWTQLAVKLLSKGSKIVTGDFSKFGDTIPFEFIIEIFKIINAWYLNFSSSETDIEQFQREVLAREIGNAIHLMFDILYMCICGQPSGNPLTVIINSMAVQLYLRCAWLQIMRTSKYAGLAEFHQHVAVFSYGDDMIMSVSDDVADVYNAVTLKEFFGEHNLKFTNADKSEEVVPYTSIWEADFLKRGFMAHPTRKALGVLLAPLGRDSIEDTLNWIWNSGYGFCDERSPEFKRMCVQVSEDASRNAWTRGPEYYQSFVSKLVKFWRSQGEYVVYDSWDVLDARVFDLGQILVNYKSNLTV